MKRILLTLFIIGIIMTVVGGVGTLYFNDKERPNTETFQQSYATSGVKHLTIEAQGIDVRFVEGQAMKVTGEKGQHEDIQTTKKGDNMTLTITGTPKKNIVINLNPFREKKSSQLIVTLPPSQFEKVTINGKNTEIDIDKLHFSQLTTSLISASLNIERSEIAHLNTDLNKGILDMSQTKLNKITGRLTKSQASLDEVPRDIPMMWKVDKSVVDVTYNQQLKNTVFHVNAKLSTVDLEDIEGLKEGRVGAGNNEVNVTSDYSSVTFSTDDDAS